MRDIYYKCRTQTIESNHFSNTLVLNNLKCAFLAPISNFLDYLVVSVLYSFFFLDCGFKPQSSQFFCRYFLFMYSVKLFLNYISILIKFLNLEIFMLQNTTNQPKPTVQLGHLCPWGPLLYQTPTM